MLRHVMGEGVDIGGNQSIEDRRHVGVDAGPLVGLVLLRICCGDRSILVFVRGPLCRLLAYGLYFGGVKTARSGAVARTN